MEGSWTVKDIWDVEMAIAVVNTVRTSWLTLCLARMFGKRVVIRQYGYSVLAYKWRGRAYMMDFTTPEDASEHDGKMRQ